MQKQEEKEYSNKRYGNFFRSSNDVEKDIKEVLKKYEQEEGFNL